MLPADQRARTDGTLGLAGMGALLGRVPAVAPYRRIQTASEAVDVLGRECSELTLEH